MAKTVNEMTGEVCYSKGERLASAQRYFERHPEDESINFLVYGRGPDIYCTIWNEWNYNAGTKKMKKFDKGPWDAIDSVQASFIYDVRKNGTLISEEIDEHPRSDLPKRIAIYEYEGERYRIYEYNHYPSSMELIDSYNASTKKSQSFSDMVNKQRAKSNSVAKDDDIEEIDEELMLGKNGYARNLRNLASRLNEIADNLESMDEYSHHYSYSAHQVEEFINEMDACAYELEEGFKYT